MISHFYLSRDAHLPSAQHRDSPLKRKRNESDDLAVQVVHQTLKNPLHPPPQKKQKAEKTIEIPCLEEALIAKQPIAIRMQWENLELSLQRQQLSLNEYCQIMTKIKKIIEHSTWNEKEKLIELGVLHYYIASGKQITAYTNETLLWHRIHVVESEAALLKENHEKEYAYNQFYLPSGCTAYLMRAFSRMIFPPDGSFNLGGCFAAVAMLNSSICEHLSDEMRAQMLNIVQRLINDESFRSLFQEPFEVHPQMEELICLDLKIPLKEKMSFIYVRWCLITALFTPIGQTSLEGNCYAMAPLLNILKDAPEIAVKLMIESLRKGSLSFENQEIPLSFLIDSRRQFKPDLSIEVMADYARKLAPYQSTSAALGISTPTQIHMDQHKPLSIWMEHDFKDNIDSAKDFFISHRVSFLQQLILSMIQFCAQNTVKSENSHTKSFIDQFLNSIDDAYNRMNIPRMEHDPLWKTFLLKWISSLESSIFFVDCLQDFKVIDNKVVFPLYQASFLFNGNLNDYKPFQETRRLLHFSSLSKTFQPVDHLTVFAKLCLEHLDKQSSPSDSLLLKQWRTNFRMYLQTPEFLSHLAHFQADFNKNESPITWEEYLQANSLFIIQIGGEPVDTFNTPFFQTKFQKTSCLSSTDASSHFINLCQWLVQNEDLGSQVLVEDDKHAFNLMTEFFQPYLHDPVTALQTNMILPGINLLYKQLSFEEMERTLKITLGPEEGEIFAKEKFYFSTMSCLDFSRQAESLLNKEYYLKFKSALNQVSESFNFKSFMDKLPAITKELNLTLERPAYTALIEKMKEGRDRIIFAPSEAAILLQKALIAQMPSTFISKWHLEEAIRRSFGLPQILVMANLNWVFRDNFGANGDYSDFQYLILKYDVAEKKVVNAKRWVNVEQPFDCSKLYERTQLFF